MISSIGKTIGYSTHLHPYIAHHQRLVLGRLLIIRMEAQIILGYWID
jgi:hypothetical protein